MKKKATFSLFILRPRITMPSGRVGRRSANASPPPWLGPRGGGFLEVKRKGNGQLLERIACFHTTLAHMFNTFVSFYCCQEQQPLRLFS